MGPKHQHGPAIEVFDGVISDESSLHSASIAQGRVRARPPPATSHCFATTNPGTDASCASARAHVAHKKDNPTQGTLQAIRGRPDQRVGTLTWHCAPHGQEHLKRIAACETKEEFKRMCLGRAGAITADGTHCPVQRPSEKTIRRMIYSGKKSGSPTTPTLYQRRGNRYHAAPWAPPATSRCSGRTRCRLAGGPNP